MTRRRIRLAVDAVSARCVFDWDPSDQKLIFVVVICLVSNLTLALVAPNIVNLNNTLETSAVQLADLNGDDSLDLIAIYNHESLLAIWLGAGDGTFSFSSSYGTGPNPCSLTTTDLDGDDLVDVVVSNLDDSSILLYRNLGGGILSQLPLNVSTGTNTQPRKVVAADVNNDGLFDYVTANYNGGGISVVLSGPNFTYNLVQGLNTLHFNPVSLIVTHLNNDAHVDLAVANGGGVGTTGFAFMAGFGNGSFAAPIFYNTSGNTMDIAAGDFNSDGSIDVALVNNAENSLAILFGNGLGFFSNMTIYQNFPVPVSLVTCDANRDGFLDLYMAVHNGGTINLFLGQYSYCLANYLMLQKRIPVR